MRIGPPAPPPPTARPRAAIRIGPRLELRRFRYGFRPLLRRRFAPDAPPFLLPSPPPDTFVQPEGPGPSPLIEGAPEDLPALAHGFHLNVAVGAGRTFAAPPTLNRFVEVGQALGRCFAPPAGLGWGSITLRVAFKRDGSVFGLPRVPYSDAATPDQKSALAHSLLAGLKSCTPLPLSPSLGAAVAGEIFAIRFIHEDQR
ncbi:hypothetical protein D3273_11815 [Lichenibacterium minor]|uniref:TonB C-terminal domain-containing protein n=1 Tax=Lichenibacterium minor TaxID=2316528 RepID=A0A4Q2U7D3_9HYPH|nr:hypothetical protein D3273_11815 [Lichenibacterium minor]